MTTKKQKPTEPARRDVKVSVMLTAEEAARLDEFRAYDSRVTRSHAISLLIERALDSQPKSAAS